MNDLKQKIADFVKKNGPVIPVKVAKALGSNLMFTSAILSELVSNKILKISYGKVGNSPLYYASGQEPKLIILKSYLSGRLKEALDIIKEQKVLRDSECEPWLRVALRDLKDFAHPVTVQIKGNNEVFWKWYLMTPEDARKTITSMVIGTTNKLSITESQKGKKPAEVSMPDPRTANLQTLQKAEGNQSSNAKTLEPSSSIMQSSSFQTSKIRASNNQNIQNSLAHTTESTAELKSTPMQNELISIHNASGRPVVPAQQEKLSETAKTITAEKKSRGKEQPANNKEQLKQQCSFYAEVLEFLEKNNIRVIDSKIVRKNRELNFIVHLPSPVGNLTFFVKAKNKNKINDADLSLAYSEGQQSKLPVIFISKGNLTKKAGSFISDNIRGLVFKKI